MISFPSANYNFLFNFCAFYSFNWLALTEEKGFHVIVWNPMIYFNDWNITQVEHRQQDQESPLLSSFSLPPSFYMFLQLHCVGRKLDPQA